MGEKKKSLELKKHVAAIHSANKLSLLQRKIANALLFNAYDDLLIKDEYIIHIATLCKLIGYDSNDHKTIKKALVNLLATVIEWNLVDGDKLDAEGVWNASSIIADASIDGAFCTYSYSNKMKNLLHRPELYGRLSMVVQAQFQSSYGLALYENCIRYQNIEQTPWFDIPKFRKLMGVEDGKYKIFRDFKSRVLDKAIEEVNKYSPIKVTPQFRKQGRTVVSIQFSIQHIKNEIIDATEIPQSTLAETLKLRYGLSKKQMEEVFTSYEENYIKEKINVIESSASYAKGKISNLAKYLICALKDDYQPIKSSHTQLSLLKLPLEKEVKQGKVNQKQNRVEEYHRYQNREIIKLFNKKSKKEQNKITEEFEKYLGKGIYRDIYFRDGLANVLIQDQLCVYIKQKKPEFINSISSYEDFCKEKEEETY